MQKLVTTGVRSFRTGEHLLLAIGLTLLVIWAGARFHGSISSRIAMLRFRAAAAGISGTNLPPGVDYSQWSPKRIAAYKDSLTAKKGLPLAILRIPKINLEVPVFNDTDDLTLNRGVGRIVGTSQIGQVGNIGIAGHRDGFFRGLKDVVRDDSVELVRLDHTDHYVVADIRIVNPEDVYVLDPTPVPTVTLITCYPFYFVGNAPQRYVVTASVQSSSQTDASASTTSSSLGKKINNKEITK
jgi:sortase A